MDKEKTETNCSNKSDKLFCTKYPAWEHIFIYKKIKEKAKFSQYIRPKQLLEILKRNSSVPKTLHYPILKQMEEEGLIKRINHQKYEFTDAQRNEKIKEVNKKLEILADNGKRQRMLKAMEECELIKEDPNTRFKILSSDFDKKIEMMGNFTFW